MFDEWLQKVTPEIVKKNFLVQINEKAEALGVSLTVEHLLPGLQKVITSEKNSPEKLQLYVRLLFKEMTRLIGFLSRSEITAGYNGIRENLIPIFKFFFESDLVEDTTRSELQKEVVDQLALITKTLIHDDRVELVLPIMLDLLKDVIDEEKRILGLEMLDALVFDLGPDICRNYLMYEIVSLQDDSVYRVRKETVKHIVNISKVLEKQMFLGCILPVFKKLCNDQIWGVRR